MAQLQGEERVGACISLRKGKPSKKEYRTFTVKSVAKDDLRMMKEVINRWIKRQDEWPDLVLLDGGETHLNMMRNLLVELNLENKTFTKISVFMNVFDCHVNRTPCSGKVSKILYKPIKFFGSKGFSRFKL